MGERGKERVCGGPRRFRESMWWANEVKREYVVGERCNERVCGGRTS